MKAAVAVVLLSCLVAVSAQHADLLGLNLPDFEVVDPEAESFVQSVLQREQQGPANVLIKYLVPPPVQKEFIQVFKEVKDQTTKEEGNKMYFLLKPITDNVSYYIYGQWETAEDYAEHLKSDYTKKLLEFDYKKGVVFKLEPLLVVD